MYVCKILLRDVKSVCILMLDEQQHIYINTQSMEAGQVDVKPLAPELNLSAQSCLP
jgi:hypothetical protein